MLTPDDGNSIKTEAVSVNPSIDTDPLAPSVEERLDQIQARLRQMLLLAEASAASADPEPDRQALQEELERLRNEIDRIAGRIP